MAMTYDYDWFKATYLAEQKKLHEGFPGDDGATVINNYLIANIRMLEAFNSYSELFFENYLHESAWKDSEKETRAKQYLSIALQECRYITDWSNIVNAVTIENPDLLEQTISKFVDESVKTHKFINLSKHITIPHLKKSYETLYRKIVTILKNTMTISISRGIPKENFSEIKFDENI